MDPQDTYDTRQAKQKASVKWLLSKAFNNKVPENLREPFYRDYENQEFLKPQIVGCLANAELYCLALSNIYSDPNYHNLNHSSILQTLARKGVLSECPEMQLTETVLIQTNPLKLAAHMMVIEAIMTLYGKEVVTGDRVIAAIQRFNHIQTTTEVRFPEDHEQGLMLWVDHACAALKKRIDSESDSDKNNTLAFDPITSVNDLCDGVRLACLISFYCPDELPWNQLLITKLPTISDSVHNLMLVYQFCQHALPYTIFHMMPEDVTYLKRTMKQNLLVFLADVFNVLEIHPVKCVRYPGIEKVGRVSRPQSAHVVVKKTQSLQSSFSEPTTNDSDIIQDSGEFVVHKVRTVPTLNTVVNMNASRDKLINDAKDTAAGKPSHWDDKKTSYAGRRSRRNSVTDDSQLTIENFGGSQEHLNMIGRNPDKDLSAHVGRKLAKLEPHQPIEMNLPIRSSLKDSRSNIHIGYDSDNEKQDKEKEAPKLMRQLSCDAISLQTMLQSNQSTNNTDRVDGEMMNKMLNFADISKQKMTNDHYGLHNVSMIDHAESISPKPTTSKPQMKQVQKLSEKKTTFAALPNTTTWQQQSTNMYQQDDNGHIDDGLTSHNLMPSQLNDIRMKLEEKRKHIENEKKKIELVVNQQRQKVGKAAFLQAINKDTLEEAGREADLKRFINQENICYNQPQIQQSSDIDRTLHNYHHCIDKGNSSLLDVSHNMASQHQLLNEQFTQHTPNVQRQQQMSPQSYQMQPQFNTASLILKGNTLQGLQGTHSSPRVIQPVDQNQFYLHDHSQKKHGWGLSMDSTMLPYEVQQRTNIPAQNQGFILHDHNKSFKEINYQNGDHKSVCAHQQQQPSIQSQSPAVYRQISQLIGEGDGGKRSVAAAVDMSDCYEKSNSSIIHSPIRAPAVDDMEPQNISFIGNSEENYVPGISKLNISSGTRTYRIPSPTRPHIARNSFQPSGQVTNASVLDTDNSTEKGFYISFDSEQPKKPKPPLRVKKSSPKKEKANAPFSNIENELNVQVHKGNHKNTTRERDKMDNDEIRIQFGHDKQKLSSVVLPNQKYSEADEPEIPTALVIGSELKNLDPNSMDEMEKKKERIMLLSLQRRQQQEEAKEKKEVEAQARREKEKQKEEDRLRRKREQEARRIAILEQHKLKKAIEEAEREGKVLDRSDLMGTMKSGTKMRSKGSTGRPRPKTIHVDSGSVEMAEVMLQPSQGKKGSSSNLSVNSHIPSSTLRRDYYRGSQDSLADRGHNSTIYKDVAETEMRGMSPCGNSYPLVGRRGSYITSRDQGQTRDKSKYSTIQTFKGRKSNSMMNLYGSSSDQDSMVYRYGDTDSGLGRATPPRRAPSPGMGQLRHLPSPSGPGSLPPGFMNKRRMFDDGSSDISSTPSSIIDYTGPKLYKQPTTKSNRGIMLNAVEYCVFPGVVNREAKHRVLEEIARSESKHFLILFRDAGCQFRALYSYCPERDEVLKLYGTGPKQVNDKMFDKFFKYNSGGKCFSQVHTKHLTVTIDAFTIHNSLWQGKKVTLPSKKDMALVI